MTSIDNFYATAMWGSRRETPQDLAERLIKFARTLESVDPVLARWYFWPGKEKPIALFEPDSVRVAKLIESGVGTNDDDGSPQPLYGYQCLIHNNDGSDRPRSITVHMFAGKSGPFCFNSVSVHTDRLVEPDPDVVTYKIFKGILLALAEAFEPDEVMAYPSSVFDFWPKGEGRRPIIELAWITYVAPRYAHLITPPASAIVERRPDGGLLMAATEETFDVANPRHLAVAQEIEAAAAPFNVQTKAESDAEIARWRASVGKL